MEPLKPGDKAPKFTLLDQSGRKVSLSDFKGKRVLLYFFPRADTPGCTTQSCAVRDARKDLAKRAIVALGVSPDQPSNQKKFDGKYSLGFPLLSDPDHKAAEAYGTWAEKSMYGRKYMGIVRSAFLIDGGGKIITASYRISPKNTVPMALDDVQ